jgi:hypothetical protein
MSLINHNQLLVVNLSGSLATQTQYIQPVPFKVRQVNLRVVASQDATGPYTRLIHLLHTSLFGNDAIGFVNNSPVPFQFGNNSSIRYYYENPIYVGGNYTFWLEDILGNFVTPVNTNLFYVYMEFISENNNIINTC